MTRASQLRFDGVQALLPFRQLRRHAAQPAFHTSDGLRSADPASGPFDARQLNFVFPLVHRGERAQFLNRSMQFAESPPSFWVRPFAAIDFHAARRCQVFTDELRLGGRTLGTAVPQIETRMAKSEDCPPEARRGLLQVHLPGVERMVPVRRLTVPHFVVRKGELSFKFDNGKRINLSRDPSVPEMTEVIKALRDLPFVSTALIRTNHLGDRVERTIFYIYRGPELVPFATSSKSWSFLSSEEDLDHLDFALTHPDGTEFVRIIYLQSGTGDMDAMARYIQSGIAPKANEIQGQRTLKLELNEFQRPYDENDRYARERFYLAYGAVDLHD